MSVLAGVVVVTVATAADVTTVPPLCNAIRSHFFANGGRWKPTSENGFFGEAIGKRLLLIAFLDDSFIGEDARILTPLSSVVFVVISPAIFLVELLPHGSKDRIMAVNALLSIKAKKALCPFSSTLAGSFTCFDAIVMTR